MLCKANIFADVNFIHFVHEKSNVINLFEKWQKMLSVDKRPVQFNHNVLQIFRESEALDGFHLHACI